MRATSLRSLALTISFLVVGCGGPEQEEQTDMGLSEVEQTQLLNDFKSATRQRLDEVDRKIQLLTERVDSIGGDLQIEMQTTINSFQTRSEEVEEQLRYLAWRSETAWEEDKTLVTRALDALARDVDDQIRSIDSIDATT